jgi:predicted DNA-binding transcriptional regulator AlpA
LSRHFQYQFGVYFSHLIHYLLIIVFDLQEAVVDNFDSVRVLTKPETLKMLGLSGPTWHRLEQRGQTPPKTDLSPNRIGYRVIDIMNWLDARRRGGEVAKAAQGLRETRRNAERELT